MNARHRLTILGCASSPGVPRIGNDWGSCDPTNPKNRRRRASVLIERFGEDGERTVVVIDTGQDFREQMLSAGIGWADGVVYTHPHADHTHGLDDLRAFMFNRKRRVDVWCDGFTSERLHEAFGYCFASPPGSNYPPILSEHRIVAGEAFEVSGPGGPLHLLPVLQEHGDINSLGFRVGNIGYSSDISGLSEASQEALAGLDCWIVDGLRHRPHPSHFCVSQAVEWSQKLGSRRTILTHMHNELDYDRLMAELPEGVEPAYDGLIIEFSA